MEWHWDSGSLGIPDIYIYIDPRVRRKSAQSNHDLIVAWGLWVSGSLGIPDIYTYTYIYIYIHIYRSQSTAKIRTIKSRFNCG